MDIFPMSWVHGGSFVSPGFWIELCFGSRRIFLLGRENVTGRSYAGVRAVPVGRQLNSMDVGPVSHQRT